MKNTDVCLTIVLLSLLAAVMVAMCGGVENLIDAALFDSPAEMEYYKGKYGR